jgi:hypothetical protein
MAALNFSPLKSMVLRKLIRRNATYRDLSDRKWGLCPSETRIGPPAVYFEEDLERVTAVMHDTTEAQEAARIKGGLTEHRATVAYSVKDVMLIDGALYKGSMKHVLVPEHRRFVTAELPTIGSRTLACTLYGSMYFGHWLSDDLTLHLAADEPVIAARNSYSQESDYCKLFKIEQTRVARAHFKRLVILDDVGQNSYKQRRYEELRSRLQVKSAGNRLVYIRRGSTRALTNTQEVENYLRSQGFAILDPERESAAQMASGLAGAALVVGVEGSHLVPAVYTADAICVIQPPNRFNNVIKDYTDCLGMRYAFTVGTAVSGGYSVELDRLKKIIDRLNA